MTQANKDGLKYSLVSIVASHPALDDSDVQDIIDNLNTLLFTRKNIPF